MLPFLFGPAGRELFGMLHSRPPGIAARHAVLLITSFGREGVQLHRVMRTLAERVNRSGIDVLRLDHFGTGDAGGSDSDVDLTGWSGDIVTAHRELMRRSGVTQVTWLGVRVGANVIQAAAAAAKPGGLSRLILVDPIADGRAFLDSMRTIHFKHEERWDEPESTAFRNDEALYIPEALGYAISPTLCDQMRALRFVAPDEGLPAVVIADASLPEGAATSHACAGKQRVRFVNHSLGDGWVGRIVPPQTIKLLVDEAAATP